ncbi:uncharacterized protein Nmag_0108 [Natrialba magadii ATCC 43099]|uniref:Uncharacterized protein n=2 Tax=Natrialba magadii (strain ATCC 43099 / DSM 3394 / CCM 3739 / CIP 104546 / IAM 13178 / JCM 8861 / NBRC 102185 / NCIMB 2190 / MS3) TaxID=547559 RepID=D3SWB4_NATMM|nr:uncharacterized protein Nmag_0108 [Natrialba magadii ATCC 43099]
MTPFEYVLLGLAITLLIGYLMAIVTSRLDRRRAH